ncbi:MAG: phosphohistidine phosphatase SixA [Acidobacteria bacterium]|nr:phosphohistidine phosphatase SixA [Acidobacteriota bacterium]
MASHETKQQKDAQGFRLHVMRHGIAVARGSAGFPDDAERPLTPEGKVKMKAIARGLLHLGVRVDSIITSPLVRARETAEIVAQAYGHDVSLEFADDLKPGGSLEMLVSHLARHLDRRSILVVGHEPDLSVGVAKLIGASPKANFQFKKGGCCRIDFEDFPPHFPGKLQWWLTPRVLRKIKL